MAEIFNEADNRARLMENARMVRERIQGLPDHSLAAMRRDIGVHAYGIYLDGGVELTILPESQLHQGE